MIKKAVCSGKIVLSFLAILFLFPINARSGAGLVKVRLEVPTALKSGHFAKSRRLKLPPGFKVRLFASNLKAPRFMAFGPDGHLYVTLPRAGAVVVLPDRDKDNVADEAVLFADGLDEPHGITFRGPELIIAENGGLLLLKDSDGDLKADKRVRLSDDIPGGGGHWTRTVAIGGDKSLYVSAGSSCNVCIEKDRRRAAVLKFPAGGGKGEVYASGLRNSVGIAFDPRSGSLWGVDNGRDRLGDDLPPEELNLITDKSDYGWPYCYGDRVPDPRYGSVERCADTTAPVVKMQAHSAPLGIAFGYKLKFPAPYTDALYIAFHGSWNRSVPTGYKLVAIPFAGGRPTGEPFDFVSGWLVGESAWGRPVAPVVGPDGALYLSDDKAGAIYRISAGR